MPPQQQSYSLLPTSFKSSAFKPESGDMTEDTADFSNREEDENQQIAAPQTAASPPSPRRKKGVSGTASTPALTADSLRSLLSTRAVAKSKKGSNPRSQATALKEELVERKSSRCGRRNSTHLSGFLESTQDQQQHPKDHRCPLTFRSSHSFTEMRTSSSNELRGVLEKGRKSRAPKRTDSVSLCGESTTTPKKTFPLDLRSQFGDTKASDSSIGARFLQHSATEWEEEYHKIAELDSDDDNQVISFKTHSLANRSASPRRYSSPRRCSSPRRAIEHSPSMVDDEMWRRYEQIVSDNAHDEKRNDDATNRGIGSERKIKKSGLMEIKKSSSQKKSKKPETKERLTGGME